MAAPLLIAAGRGYVPCVIAVECTSEGNGGQSASGGLREPRNLSALLQNSQQPVVELPVRPILAFSFRVTGASTESRYVGPVCESSVEFLHRENIATKFFASLPKEIFESLRLLAMHTTHWENSHGENSTEMKKLEYVRFEIILYDIDT